MAAKSEIAVDMYTSFATWIIGQQRSLGHEVAALDAAVAQADDIVSDAFQAFKSLEISDDIARRDRRQKEARAEQADLDEIAMTTYCRKRSK